MKNRKIKIISIILSAVLALVLCSCGQVSPSPGSYESGTLGFSEIGTATHPSFTDILKTEPLPGITDGSKPATLLYSQKLRNIASDPATGSPPVDLFGGFAFTVSSGRELGAFLQIIEAFSGQNEFPDDLSALKECNANAGFFKNSVLVFYVDNCFMQDEDLGSVVEVDNEIILRSDYTNKSKPTFGNAIVCTAGVSCWAVNKAVLNEKDVWFRSESLYYFDKIFSGVESVEDLVALGLNGTTKAIGEASFVKIEPLSFEEKLGTEKYELCFLGDVCLAESTGSITDGPFIYEVTSFKDFDALTVTAKAVFDTETALESVDEAFFEKNKLVFVIQSGGELTSSAKELTLQNYTEITQRAEGSGLWISFFSTAK